MSRARRVKKATKARTRTEEIAAGLALGATHAQAAVRAFDELAQACGRLRMSFKFLGPVIAQGIKEGKVPGVCRACGCMDDVGCPAGCSWVDETRTRCSVCFPTPAFAAKLERAAKRDQKSARKRRKARR